MRIFTSRWANRDLADLDCQPVSISRGDKKGVPFSYRKLWLLAPDRQTFQTQDADQAKVSYRAGLDEIGLDAISDAFEQIRASTDGRPLVLLCHEHTLNGEDCHRRWFSDWWLEQTGQEIPELEPGMLPDADGVAQPRLL